MKNNPDFHKDDPFNWWERPDQAFQDFKAIGVDDTPLAAFQRAAAETSHEGMAALRFYSIASLLSHSQIGKLQ